MPAAASEKLVVTQHGFQSAARSRRRGLSSMSRTCDLHVKRRVAGCFLKVCSFDAPRLQALTEPWAVLEAEDHWSQNKISANEVTWTICCNN